LNATAVGLFIDRRVRSEERVAHFDETDCSSPPFFKVVRGSKFLAGNTEVELQDAGQVFILVRENVSDQHIHHRNRNEELLWLCWERAQAPLRHRSGTAQAPLRHRSGTAQEEKKAKAEYLLPFRERRTRKWVTHL
jgi:hypothetical protein